MSIQRVGSSLRLNTCYWVVGATRMPLVRPQWVDAAAFLDSSEKVVQRCTILTTSRVDWDANNMLMPRKRKSTNAMTASLCSLYDMGRPRRRPSTSVG